MRKIIVFMLISAICVGCSFVDTIEYEVTYTAISSTPCQITYSDEDHNLITIDNVTYFSKTFKMIAYGDYNRYWTDEFIIKERNCIGSISIKINEKSIIKKIESQCCCEEQIEYSRIL